MKSRTALAKKAWLKEPADFSIVLGGPLFQIWQRAYLSDDVLGLLIRRVGFISLLAWIPLLILSIAEGTAINGSIPVPFLLDAEVHLRLLVALPLLIISELVVHQRLRPLVRQFWECDFIPQDAMASADATIEASLRWRNSAMAEIVMIAFVYIFGVMYVWRRFVAISQASTWYSTATGGELHLSLTGMWYAFVSLPIYQFLLVRWYYRIAIWIRFLWKMSRIPLKLVPTHPDGVGGLGFLAYTVHAFVPLAASHGAMLTGMLANRIFYLGMDLPQFKVEILMVVILMMALTVGPLFFFSPLLAEVKRIGLREYGKLAGSYVREFDSKWLREEAPKGEPLMGSGDIQSLADLGNSFEKIEKMRVVPITRDVFAIVIIATLAPVLPLVLTMISPEELIKKLFGMVF